MAQTGSIVSITSYVDAIRRRWAIVAALVIFGALLGFVLLSSQQRVFVAESRVQVRPIVSQSSDPNLDVARQIDIESEVRVASSQRVAEWALALVDQGEGLNSETFNEAEVRAAAAEVVASGQLDREGAQSQLAQLEVEVAGDSNILSFTASANDPERARAIAQSTAVAYLEFRASKVSSDRVAVRERLALREAKLIEELTELAEERSEAQAAAAAANPDFLVEIPQNAAEIAKTQELTEIGSNYAALEVSTVDPGVVLTDAEVPLSRQGLPASSGLILGSLLGLVVGLSIAYILDRGDDRIRSANTEISALGAQVLGSAPVDRKKFGLPAPVETLASGSSPSSDAYRRLHGSTTFALDNGDKSLVLVAGITSSYAGSLVLANMAVTAARAGRRTLLVGADLRQRLMAQYLGMRPTTGLSDVIMSGSSLAEVIEAVPRVENLNFLGAGTQTGRPDKVIQSEAFGRLMSALETDYDLVFVEAPPVLTAADAVDIARVCDGALLVVDSDSESRQTIADAIAQLRKVGSAVDGVVVAER